MWVHYTNTVCGGGNLRKIVLGFSFLGFINFTTKKSKTEHFILKFTQNETNNDHIFDV